MSLPLQVAAGEAVLKVAAQSMNFWTKISPSITCRFDQSSDVVFATYQHCGGRDELS